MIKDKLAKIKTMAERGTPGERQAARRLLSELLKKHNLTIDDLTTDETSLVWLRYKYPYERRLITQILCRLLNVDEISIYKQKGKKAVGVQLTPRIHAEFKEFWATYRKPLTDEVQAYINSVFSAFCQKHALFSNQPSSGERRMTDAERERLSNIYHGLANITSPTKQLEDK